MSHQQRISLDDSIEQIVTKLSDGNPGSISVIVQLLKGEAAIDPDTAVPGLGTLFYFDSFGIYGSDIWVLFKDVCGGKLVNLVALFRGFQLGLVNRAQIEDSLKLGESVVDLKDLIIKIKLQLPNFYRV